MFLSGSSNIKKAVNGPACRWYCLKLLKGHDSKLFACYAPKLSVLTLNMNVFVLHDLKWMAQCGEKRRSIQGTVGKGWDRHFLTRMQRKGRKRRTMPEGLAQWVTAGTWKESTQEKSKKQKQQSQNHNLPPLSSTFFPSPSVIISSKEQWRRTSIASTPLSHDMMSSNMDAIEGQKLDHVFASLLANQKLHSHVVQQDLSPVPITSTLSTLLRQQYSWGFIGNTALSYWMGIEWNWRRWACNKEEWVRHNMKWGVHICS